MGWGGDSKYSGSMTEKESISKTPKKSVMVFYFKFKKVLCIFFRHIQFLHVQILTIILCFSDSPIFIFTTCFRTSEK